MTKINELTKFDHDRCNEFSEYYTHLQKCLSEHVDNTIEIFTTMTHHVDAIFDNPEELEGELFDILDSIVFIVGMGISANCNRLEYYSLEFKVKIEEVIYIAEVTFEKGRVGGEYEYIENATLYIKTKDGVIIQEIDYVI